MAAGEGNDGNHGLCPDGGLIVMRWVWKRRQREKDLDAEIESHFRLAVRDQIEAGVDQRDAQNAARREFGNVSLVKEVSREMWGWTWVERLWQDGRYALRMLRKNGVFTVTSVLSLALGIGANTAIFTITDAVLWKNLPVNNPEELVTISGVGANGEILDGVPSTFVQDLQRESAFSDTFMVSQDGLSFSIDSGAERIVGEAVSANYFSALGVKMLLGRDFSSQAVSGHWEAGVVLSYEFWRRRFLGDRSAIGKVVHLNTYPYTIFGVAPPGFFGTEVGSSPELRLAFMPPGQSLEQIDLITLNRVRVLRAFARLRKGVTLRQAEAATNAQFQRFLRQTADRRFENMELLRIRLNDARKGTSRLRAVFARPLLLLFVAVGLLLTTACANVANLLLAKSSSRRREIAVRMAIGASSSRLLRQLLTESLLLTLMGGLLALAVTFLATKAFLLYLPQTHLRIVLDLHPDIRGFAFTLAVAIVTGLVFGLAPALESVRSVVTEDLKNDSAASLGSLPGKGWFQLRPLLVGAQVAFSLVLLIGAGLLVQSLEHLKHENYGFYPERVVLFTMKPQHEIYTADRIRRLIAEISRRVNDMPAVRCAGWAESGPLDSRGTQTATISTTDVTERTIVDSVTPRFFQTIGLAVLEGRDFAVSDRLETPAVVILNSILSKALFGEQEPIGRTVFVGSPAAAARSVQVIGVVNGTRYGDPHSPLEKAAYFAMQQQTPYMPTLHVRAAMSNPGSIVSDIRRQFGAVDGDIPVFNVKTLSERVDDSLARERLIAALSGLFGIAALMLASIGLYGVIAYNVTRRTREIGLRMALGATRIEIVRMVLREAGLFALGGSAAGLLMALCMSRPISAFLSGIASTDPVTFAGATTTIGIITIAAGLIPAWRACKVEPTLALRHE